MLAKELIEALSKLPPETKILCDVGNRYAATPRNIITAEGKEPIAYLTDYEERWVFEIDGAFYKECR